MAAKKSPLDEWQQFNGAQARSVGVTGGAAMLLSNSVSNATYANAATVSR